MELSIKTSGVQGLLVSEPGKTKERQDTKKGIKSSSKIDGMQALFVATAPVKISGKKKKEEKAPQLSKRQR